jgi:penicillin amidase
MQNRLLKISARILVALVAITLILLLALYFTLRASLPALDGELTLSKLANTVTVTRDVNGTVAIAARDTVDAMRALGFVHAQERFFEMDLTRRAAAGELSALLGSATIEYDKKKRQHRFRTRMNEVWPTLPIDQKNIMTAYAEGVNSGVAALRTTSWQYTLLRVAPQPWTEIDSMLVMCEMFYMLQSKSFDGAFENARLREKMSEPVFAWLKPLGGTWDAALDGSIIAPVAMPTSEQLNVRASKVVSLASAIPATSEITEWSPLATSASSNNENYVGSNAWAVNGTLTKTGAGMLANDMHLGFSVPNIWFRAEFLIDEIANKTDVKKIAGVTLPGVPALVTGSNGNIAWGFTNSYGKWFDWVPITAAEPITIQRESIAVKSGEPIEMDVRETRFGPILETVVEKNATKVNIAEPIEEKKYALHWIAHQPGAINPNIMQLMFAKTVDDALLIAQQSGVPHQNFLVVDSVGNLGWTIAGRMPRRYVVNNAENSGLNIVENSQRAGWAMPADISNEWLPVAQYPVIKNPPAGRLWTANNRQLGGESGTGGDSAGGTKIGEGGFDLGARGQQIRDRLFLLRQKPNDKPIDEAALYEIQLDTEARFMKRWAQRMQNVAARNPNHANAAEASRLLAAWNGKADADQAGYLLAKTFRQKVLDQLWKSWVSAATGTEPRASWDGRFEYAAVAAIETKAPHLLPLPFKTWDAFLAAQFSAAAEDLIKANGSLAASVWGKSNVATVRHPLSRAVPALGYFLDMPRVPVSGDSNLPKVVAGNFGASQRTVVSPGHEETAILTMPGGQSGHPLSPFYGAGHGDWLAGVATPLLANVTTHTMRLIAPAVSTTK